MVRTGRQGRLPLRLRLVLARYTGSTRLRHASDTRSLHDDPIGLPQGSHKDDTLVSHLPAGEDASAIPLTPAGLPRRCAPRNDTSSDLHPQYNAEARRMDTDKN